MKQKKRERAFHNLESATSVGVIFDATRQETYTTSKQFIENLRNQNIDAVGIGYVKSIEALSYFPYHKGIDFFSISNKNWYLKPLNSNVESFSEKPLDMLIDLTMEEHLQLKYIVGLSNAKFKVGRGSINDRFYDFALDITEDAKLDYYLKQIKHYLSVMKKKK